MEQKFIVCNLPEKKVYELSELTKGAELNLSENLSIKVKSLTGEKMEFTIGGDTYVLNREWQVMRIKDTIFFFADEKKNLESVFDDLKKIFDEMCTNEDYNNYWKNIILAQEAMHILKDDAPKQDTEILKEFCEAMMDQQKVDYENNPRLLLSFINYYHVLSGSTERWEQETQMLLGLIDPNLSEQEKLDLLTQNNKRKFDPIQLTQEWEDMIVNAKKEYREYILSHMNRRGFNHILGQVWKKILSKYGFPDWRSGIAMNGKNREVDLED